MGNRKAGQYHGRLQSKYNRSGTMHTDREPLYTFFFFEQPFGVTFFQEDLSTLYEIKGDTH
jgi:hypothetical protein